MLNKTVVGIVEASPIIDTDKRSALGMARSWLDNGEEIRPHPDQIHMLERDDLAKALVDAIRDADREDAIEALQAARRVVNAPFRTPEMEERDARRVAVGVVGSVKKERRHGASERTHGQV